MKAKINVFGIVKQVEAYPRIKIDLSDCDSNIFGVLGRLQKEMKNYYRRIDQSYEHERIFSELQRNVLLTKTYDEALQVIMTFVDIDY